MPLFQVTGAGFSGADEKTADRVLWVKADFEYQVQDACKGSGALALEELEDDFALTVPDEEIDFRLPQDHVAMHNRLLAFKDMPAEQVRFNVTLQFGVNLAEGEVLGIVQFCNLIEQAMELARQENRLDPRIAWLTPTGVDQVMP